MKFEKYWEHIKNGQILVNGTYISLDTEEYKAVALKVFKDLENEIKFLNAVISSADQAM